MTQSPTALPLSIRKWMLRKIGRYALKRDYVNSQKLWDKATLCHAERRTLRDAQDVHNMARALGSARRDVLGGLFTCPDNNSLPSIRVLVLRLHDGIYGCQTHGPDAMIDVGPFKELAYVKPYYQMLLGRELQYVTELTLD